MTDVILIIRHGEKPEGHSDVGLTDAGQDDMGALTIRGWVRAGALAMLFGDDRVALSGGLGQPRAIYAAAPKHGGKGLRASETVTPLADKLGITVDEKYGTGDEAALSQELAGRTGVTLVAWVHTAIIDILAGLGTIRPVPPKAWPDTRFDLVWALARDGEAWTFAEIPQHLIHGDTD